METIREWATNLTPNQKKRSTLQIISKLLNMIRLDASSDAPDYEGWVVALTALHHKAIASFYEQTYKSLSLIAQSEVNGAFIGQMDKIKIQRAWPRMAQAIQQRLKNGEDVEVLTPEIQWYIQHICSQIMLEENIENIWKSCPVKKLAKLFALDTTGWQIDSQKMHDFYFTLTQMLRTVDKKTDWDSVLTAFFERNHLNDIESSGQAASKLHSNDLQTSPSPTHLPPDAPTSIPARSTAPEKNIDIRRDTEDKTADKASSSTKKSMAHDLHGFLPIAHKDKESIAPPPEVPQAEPYLDKDGVKLAEHLLAWAKMQVQGTAVLKSSLKRSNNDLKSLEERRSILQRELFAVREEIAAKEATIIALQRDLASLQARLESEQTKSSELDEMVSKLQQMNENSAVQAVLGYKAELASALKSIVEDTHLPEAQHDTEILSTLLTDLLATLHFKGVPLEVDEK